ncbi:MAG: rod shape-determining protein MreC [Flavobacteriaceae bacterium]|nr:rod shape-determining protein MreC [Flavobacteriaceae bacterium]|tara:strand:+ start:75717 stop:76526 length:810 start_codon:yes stop_codon:yes gene_type:complete
MQQIVYFFQRYKYFLLFLFLEFISLSLIFTNLNFQKSKFLASSNFFVGGIYEKITNTKDYFRLDEINQALVEENNRLKNQLEGTGVTLTQDSLNTNQKFTYTSAKIINNTFHTQFNFLTIDIGKQMGIDSEMAVINGKGVIGITDHSSNGYTRVQSILNKNTRINARLKNTNYFGTLSWDGKDYNTVQLVDIPRQAPIKVGDTIETGGKSTIFPEAIPIGTVAKVNETLSVDNKIDVKLFNDMSNLKYIYVIKNRDKEEILKLENLENE